MKTIAYSKEALKTLRRIPANTSALIRSKVVQYATEPKSLAPNVTALQGMDGTFRLRVGDWRVVFTEDEMIIAVIRVAPRGSAYD